MPPTSSGATDKCQRHWFGGRGRTADLASNAANVRSPPIVLKNLVRGRVLGCPQALVSPLGSVDRPSRRLEAFIWPLSSCRGLRVGALRPQLREFSEVLGDGGEEKFVFRTIGAAQAWPVQAEDALEVDRTRC